MSNKTLSIIACALLVVLIGALSAKSGIYIGYVVLVGGFVPALILLAVVSTILGVMAKRGKSTAPVWGIILAIEAVALLLGLVSLVSDGEEGVLMSYIFLISFTTYTISQIFLGLIVTGIFEPQNQPPQEPDDKTEH